MIKVLSRAKNGDKMMISDNGRTLHLKARFGSGWVSQTGVCYKLHSNGKTMSREAIK